MRLRGQDLRRLLMLLGEQSEEGQRLRTRGGSAAAVLLVVTGLSVALGYGRIVLALLTAFAIVVAVIAAALFWRDRNVWAWLSARGRARRQPARPQPPAAAVTSDEAPTAEQAAAWPVRPEAADEVGSLPLPAPARSASRLQGLLPALAQRIGRAARTAGLPAASPPYGSERVANRLALGRNALGMQLRRVGEPAEAAEQHRTARALFAAAGNRRGEALAANSLALALADTGDEEAALAAFEQARALLRALGDREHEGKVLANIGIVKQRAGATDEAAELLQTALARLEPETPAYRLVERQLRRAG